MLDSLKIGKFTKEFTQAVNSLKKLICLSMNGCGIESLEGIPTECTIQRLELIGNNFPASDLAYLAKLEVISRKQSLQSLSLGSNKISTLEQLAPLAALTDLVQLDVSDTIVSELPNYRSTLFELIPHLQVLDNQDKDGLEISYSDDQSSEVLDGEEEEEEDSSEQEA